MDPITMQATPGGEETLLGILQRLRDLSQQPVVPQNPMAQLGTILQGFSAGTQGQPNPALQMYAQQRQQQLTGLGTEATIGSTLESVRRHAETERRASEKFKADTARQAKELRVKVASDFAKNPNESVRLQGLTNLRAEGMIPPSEDLASMAKEPHYGFGNTDLGRAAAAIYDEEITAGKPLTRIDAFARAKARLTTENTEAGLIASYVEGGLTRKKATLKAREDLTLAGVRPPTSIEGEVVARMQKGDLEGAQRYLKIATDLAKAKSPKLMLPRPLPTELIKEVQNDRFRAISWAKVLEGFDPSFVGLLGQMKSWSTKWSDLPGVPAFKDRAEWSAGLLSLTQTIKKDMLGSARTPAELKDLARSLPDPDENLSVAQFTASLKAFTKGFRDYVSLLPDTMQQADLAPVSVAREVAALDQAIAKLDAANIPMPKLTPAQLKKLRREGFDDKAIIREGYQP